VNKKKLAINILYAFAAQGLSMALSVLMSLIVPKMLGVEQFSYWQLFIFYSGYVGMFHFGLTDGVYLKLGGKASDKIDKKELSSMFWILFYLQIVISILAILVALLFGMSANRSFSLIATCVYMIIANLTWFLGYILQAVNNTKQFSISTILSKISFILFLVILLFRKVQDFRWFVITFIISQAISFIYTSLVSKKILKEKPSISLKTFYTAYSYARVGIKLTIANTSSIFILGIGRFFIDGNWGIIEFGKISFAISLAMFFLQFIGQVSMVLFPALRTIDDEKQKGYFTLIEKGLSIVLPAILVLYIPMKLILSKWLPQYNDSLDYLGLLLPICIFDGKMNMLFSTYLKVIRREGKLLLFNFVAVLVSLVSVFFSAILLHNISFVALSLLISIATRSLIAQKYLFKYYGIPYIKNAITEIVIVLYYLLSIFYLNDQTAFVMLLTGYVMLIILSRNTIFSLFRSGKNRSD